MEGQESRATPRLTKRSPSVCAPCPPSGRSTPTISRRTSFDSRNLRPAQFGSFRRSISKPTSNETLPVKTPEVDEGADEKTLDASKGTEGREFGLACDEIFHLTLSQGSTIIIKNYKQAEGPNYEPRITKLSQHSSPTESKASEDSEYDSTSEKYNSLKKASSVKTDSSGYQSNDESPKTLNIEIKLLPCGHFVVKSYVPSTHLSLWRNTEQLAIGHPCNFLIKRDCDLSLCITCRQLRYTTGDFIWSGDDSCTKAAIINEAMKKINDLQSSSYEAPWREYTIKESEESRFVENQLSQYIHQIHKWNPEFQSIERIQNQQTLIKWNESKIEMVDPSKSQNIFLPVTPIQADSVTLHGMQAVAGKNLLLPLKPDRCVHKLGHKGTYTALVCEVLTGRSVQTDSTASNLRGEGYDSAIVDTGESEGYLLEDTRQVLPKYVVKYYLGGLTIEGLHDLLPEDDKPTVKNLEKYLLKPSRYCTHANDHDLHYLIGESQFARIQSQRKSYRNFRLDSVTYCVNRNLIRKFLQTQKTFEAKYGNSKPILMFHGASFNQNIESIVGNNFDARKLRKGIYGSGFYFCEFPESSINYAGTSKKLILSYVLLGRSVFDLQVSEIPESFDSRVLRRDREGRGEIVIVKNNEQILPMYILNLV